MNVAKSLKEDFVSKYKLELFQCFKCEIEIHSISLALYIAISAVAAMVHEDDDNGCDLHRSTSTIMTLSKRVEA